MMYYTTVYILVDDFRKTAAVHVAIDRDIIDKSQAVQAAHHSEISCFCFKLLKTPVHKHMLH